MKASHYYIPSWLDWLDFLSRRDRRRKGFCKTRSRGRQLEATCVETIRNLLSRIHTRIECRRAGAEKAAEEDPSVQLEEKFPQLAFHEASNNTPRPLHLTNNVAPCEIFLEHEQTCRSLVCRRRKILITCLALRCLLQSINRIKSVGPSFSSFETYCCSTAANYGFVTHSVKAERELLISTHPMHDRGHPPRWIWPEPRSCRG